MDFKQRQVLNLTVLQRHDPSVVEICDQSPHAVVYKFITDKNSWDKMGVEGVLFLVKRRTSPTYALFILNRLNMDNFCLYLSDIRDLSLSDEFLICQTSEGKACGLWLFEEKDRHRFLKRILQLRKTMEQQNSTPPQPQPSTSSQQVDLLRLFEKASIAPQQPSNHANDLLSMLKSGRIEQPQPPPPPPPAAVFFNGYNNFSEDDLNKARMQPPPPPPPSYPPQSSPYPLMDKPFYPTPSISSQKTSLLQALQGGPSPQPPPQQWPSPVAPPPQFGSPRSNAPPPFGSPGLSNAPPLQPRTMLELTLPEVERRYPDPTLSKPEFIQQFLNTLQNDSSFLDTLYDRYRSKLSNGAIP
ncbi:hypothetical protein BJV82DRAFT_591584 [Fennellomyces sp. T-0311]|nr:hypothetical protein BJV82DRAFT_591584 [Fennellomyces sp. T-0311]